MSSRTTDPESVRLAYLAGIVDADGCICVYIRRTAAAETFSAAIAVKQVQREAIDLAHATFGGAAISIKRPSAKNGKPLFCWRVNNQLAAATAKRLLPYLVLKHRQAELIIELVHNIDEHRYHMGPPQKAMSRYGTPCVRSYRAIPPAARRRRQEITQETRELNDTRYPYTAPPPAAP